MRATARTLILTPFLGLLLCASGAPAAEPFDLEHLSLLRSVREPRISPDGRWLAYVVGSSDFEADERRSEVVLTSIDDGERRVVAEGSTPRWSPDAQLLAFQGPIEKVRNGEEPDEEERLGLWLHEPASGRTRLLTEILDTDHFLGHRAEEDFAFSPDGRWIVYTGAEGPASDPDTDVRVIDRMLYKTRTGFSDNRRTHLWLVPVAGGKPRLLTPGSWDEHSPAWFPDSRRVTFVSNRSENPDDNYRDNLWSVDVETGEVKQLTATLGTELSPAVSPDGLWLAWLGNVRPVNTKDSSAENTHLYRMPTAGGEPQNLTGSLDRRVRSFLWHPDGKSLWVVIDDEGKRPLVRVWIAEGEAESPRVEPFFERVVDGELQVASPSIDRSGRHLAYRLDAPTRPPEIFHRRLQGEAEGRRAEDTGGEGRALTRENASLLDRVRLTQVEPFWFDTFDGLRVQGWLMRPADHDAAKGTTYPLVLWIHGGPHGMYGFSFSERFQLLTAAGYGVLYLNPRGSTGYGQVFADGCVLNWGGGDYRDLMSGLDHALSEHPWIDPQRLAVIGGSYGGFMTNWVITQTDRFRAAVSMASVSNLVSFYGTSLYHLLIEVEFGGRPWESYPLLWQWSPLAHVEGVTTPTLFLHGENDHDVPIQQAEEMYMALAKQGAPTKMVRYPGEGHGIRGPRHRWDLYRRILDWLERWVRSERSAAGNAP